jgi:hypothetical protein
MTNDGNAWDKPNNSGQPTNPWGTKTGQKVYDELLDLRSILGGKPASGQSYGGMNYQQTGGGSTGLPGVFTGPQGLGSEAQFILQGSSGAEAALRRGYEAMLREQAGSSAEASMEEGRRSGAALGAAGVSPTLAGLIGGQRQVQAQGQVGQQMGGVTSSFESALAELAKGTASELAGVKQHEVGSLLDAYVGLKGAKMAGKGSGLADIASIASAIGAFI